MLAWPFPERPSHHYVAPRSRGESDRLERTGDDNPPAGRGRGSSRVAMPRSGLWLQLLFVCQRGGRTIKIPVLNRVRGSQISRDDLDAYHRNDRETAAGSNETSACCAEQDY